MKQRLGDAPRDTSALDELDGAPIAIEEDEGDGAWLRDKTRSPEARRESQRRRQQHRLKYSPAV